MRSVPPAILALALLASGRAEAQQLRFSDTAPGGIVAVGNTLGLSKAFNQNGPGIEDSIGTFLTLDTTSVDDSPLNPGNPWPAGTTWDWMLNGSSAVLALPLGAQVLYAELVWAGSYLYIDDVSADLETPVTLTVGNDSIVVTPDPATALTIAELSATNFAANYYMRSAEVTAFVEQHQGASYSVEGVPATQTTTINSLSAAGWTLIVAYRGEDQPIRNLSVFVGGSFVDEDVQQDYTVSGFCAPPSGPVGGSVVISALEGDADLVGDELLVAETSAGPFVALSGPNNPATNFFCSQINDDSGMLDTLGTFGNANHDAMNGVNVPGGRQGWDVTTIPLSSMAGHLDNGQTSAVVRTNTTGDSFVPVLVALELDVHSPDFATGSATTADKTAVMIGDTVEITVTLHNSGEALADNLVFTMPVDPGLDLLSFTSDGGSGDIQGAPVSEADLTSGVDSGELAVNETRTHVAQFEVVGEPDNGASFLFTPTFQHSFTVCQGDPPISESHSPPPVQVLYDAPPGQGGAQTATTSGAGGATTSGSSAGGTTGSSNPQTPSGTDSDSGCGCTTPGDQRAPAWAALALLATLLLSRRRRR